MTGSSRFAIRPGIIGLTALALIVCASVSNAQRKDLLRSNPKLLALFRPVVAKASPSVVEVRCEDQVVALGTILVDQ